tara:strand:+ start:127 stop:732 length:606 start_codon:yes stop_codon:yes gene_type:complete
VRRPIIPLARLVPLAVLASLGLSGILLVRYKPELLGLPQYWSGLGFLPLFYYLVRCYQRARQRIAGENAVEREIIIADFRVIAAERCARFWAACFALVTGSAFLIALLVWAYQGAVWFRAETWVALTWNSALGLAPTTGDAGLQKIIHWLSDTNLGVVAIIIGLLIAAPLANINHKANLKVRRCKKELAALKKMPISNYED